MNALGIQYIIYSVKTYKIILPQVCIDIEQLDYLSQYIWLSLIVWYKCTLNNFKTKAIESFAKAKW